MNELKKEFQEKGFTILKNICPNDVIKLLAKSAHNNIERCANELNCTTAEYLSNVSRWAHPSPVTQEIYPLAVSLLEKHVSDFMGTPVHLAKMNIISKSAYADNPIPCHQDISYSKDHPYEFSLWLALQNVGLDDGILEFLPQSHLTKIESAIDFWQPDFIDAMHLSSDWQQNKIAVPVQTGDAIVFDSRIWHRSAKNLSQNTRFALVTRWSRIHYQPPNNIPEKIPTAFGMWTCGQVTERLLQQGLRYCFQIKISANLLDYIHSWQQKLEQAIELPFPVNKAEAKKALRNVSILHDAAEKHNGGDAQGIVYANLWQHFLSNLSQWLAQISDQYKEKYYASTV